uniref:Uncharacterized protein n=1 Tax=Arundo donax TaxID=35708 RepID=A0A0A9AHT2_ARUDO
MRRNQTLVPLSLTRRAGPT